MVDYSCNRKYKKRIYFLLVVLSIITAYALHQIVQLIGLTGLWWIDAPSAMMTFFLLHYLFDNFIWNSDMLMINKITNIPDLNGNWQGKIISSYDSGSGEIEHSKEKKANLYISQTWTQLEIVLETDESRSTNLTGSIQINSDLSKHISYRYKNEPEPGVSKGMGIHTGIAVLEINQAEGQLEGFYFTDWHRENFGKLYFERQ